MRRRTFCRSAVSTAAMSAFPLNLLAAAAEKRARVTGDLAAIGLSGGELTLERAAVQELRDSLNGRLLLPGNDGYEAARTVWNGMIDKRPALIAVCADVGDVTNAVRFAAERGLLLAVKGGGHSFPGKSVCERGMMIDLSPMHSVAVDVARKTAVVGGGALLGHLDTASLARNLATTTGIVSHTGVGGFTLGGGMGRIDRKFGLAIDNVLAADLIAADGKLRRVGATENPDLFWAIRGGGGNFGVVTSIEYQLHDFDPTIIGGNIVYPFAQARDLLTFYAEYCETLPDEANVEPIAFVSPEGRRMILVQVCYAGDHKAAERVFAPLRAFGKPVADEIGPMAYQTLQTSDDASMRHGLLNYLKSGYLPELTPASIDAMVENYEGEHLPSFWFQHLRGRTARIAPDATAFVHRNVHSNFGISATWTDASESDLYIAGVRRFHAAVQSHMAGFYTNLNDDTEQKTWSNYGKNYPRLAEIKARFDPQNLFRLNANVRPAKQL